MGFRLNQSNKLIEIWTSHDEKQFKFICLQMLKTIMVLKQTQLISVGEIYASEYHLWALFK